MLRESLNADARYVFVFVTPSVNGIAIQKRNSDGEISDLEFLSNNSVTFPVRLKIERSGSHVRIAYGQNDLNWNYADTLEFNFKAEIYMGIALCTPDENAYMNWYASNYIQLYCYKDFDMHSMPLDFNNGLCKDGDFYSFCPFVKVQHVKNFLMNQFKDNLVEVIINLINNDNYIDLVLNEFYVPMGKGYGEYPYWHGNMIYGYDLTEKYFNVVGYDRNSRVRYSKLKFEDFAKAYDKNNEDNALAIIRIHDYYSYKFNLVSVKKQLIDYINSDDTFSSLSIMRNYDSRIVHGIEVYDYLIINIPDHYRDIRPLHVIYEHKKLMLLRLKHLKRNSVICEEVFYKLFSEYQRLEQLALQIRNLQLKNIMKPKKDNLERIKDNLVTIKAKELELIPILIDQLKT